MKVRFRHSLSLATCAIAVACLSFSTYLVAQPPPATTVSISRVISLVAADEAGNAVRDLKKEDLAIKVGGKSVTDFDLQIDSSPSAFVLAVDNSGSLRQHLDRLVHASREVFGQNERKNLVVLMRFISRDKIQIAEKFSSDRAYFESNLKMLSIEGGQTALIDAVYKSVQIVSGQSNLAGQYRRAVVVISDGEDRDSANTEKGLLELIAKENVQVFIIGLTSLLSNESGFISRSPAFKAKMLLETIARESGGVALFPKAEKMTDAAKMIGALLNERYILTLRSATPIAPGEEVVIDLAPARKRKNTELHYKRVMD